MMLSLKKITSVEPLHRYFKLCCVSQDVLNKDLKFKADPKVMALRDKLIYCDYLDHEKVKVGFMTRIIKRSKETRKEKYWRNSILSKEPVFSVVLNDAIKKENNDVQLQEDNTSGETKLSKPVHMPYSRTDNYENVPLETNETEINNSILINQKYKDLYEKYLELKNSSLKDKVNFEDCMENHSEMLKLKGETWKVPKDWMTDFEYFDDTLLEKDWDRYYGTPDPNLKVSSIPCGGCGALLHCRDPELPGYLPSELFKNRSNDVLKVMTCQRCHFLKVYNASLEVKVSHDEYPELLKVIKNKKCAVILMVDLTDFPCSIWPDIKSVLHPMTPIFLVGNKVDLLPRDTHNFFAHVKEQLFNTVQKITNIKKENIIHVDLISAKTGYRIEELINKLQVRWKHKGDVYLIGCTNVGKSSLFNALLKSDYCKVQAVDLVQRATISAWPGTTLNLLKFPILNPTDKKLYLRVQRLNAENKFKIMEKEHQVSKFKSLRNMKYATLQGRIGRTFNCRTLRNAVTDPFSETSHKNHMRVKCLDETRPEYAYSRWFYDTPGTIQPDQVLDLLTTDELLHTLPNGIISPRTFLFKPGQTVFLAGLGRLDYLSGDKWMRCTIFMSRELPITMCHTVDADDIYNELLKTEAFTVPINDPERLKSWPGLESKEIQVTGISRIVSVADVVLSSAGWVALTPDENHCVTLRVWTPQARGIYLRIPALLRKSICKRGKRAQETPMYRLGQQVLVK